MFGEELFISTVFAAGFLSFFAPCTFPLIPVYIGILTDKEGKGRLTAVFKTLLFVLGLSTSFVLLGFGTSALSRFISGRAFMTVAGIIVILLGLHQMGAFRIKALETYKVLRFKKGPTKGNLSAYLLGITFSFGWTPCVGPVLGAVLVVSSSGNQPLYGVWMMLVYTLGLAVPFLVMALLSGVLIERFEKIERYAPTIKKVGGGLIVLMGILLLTQNTMVFTQFFERLLSGN